MLISFQKDVFNIKSGGMVNMQAVKSGQFKQNNDDAYDTGIGTQFSAETNKRDEDEEMMKYIEEQLQAKKGSGDAEDVDVDVRKFMTPEEAALYSIPEHLRQSSTQRSEEMLSNQMLSGIPEVDLGIEAKIKNIEATEEAKQKLIVEQRNRKDTPSHFVPTNMAVNFVQHNRCKWPWQRQPGTVKFTNKFICIFIAVNVDDSRKRRPVDSQQNTGKNKEQQKKKATDDFHYDKFRKQFRKHWPQKNDEILTLIYIYN